MTLATLDTNVILAGLLSTRGASFQILESMKQGVFVPAISVALFLEYEAVLTRPVHLATMKMSRNDVDDFLDVLAALGQPVSSISYRWRPLLPDPDDNLVVECAVASGSAYLVTLNSKDFDAVRRQFRFAVMSPAAFLHVLRS